MLYAIHLTVNRTYLLFYCDHILQDVAYTYNLKANVLFMSVI